MTFNIFFRISIGKKKQNALYKHKVINIVFRILLGKNSEIHYINIKKITIDIKKRFFRILLGKTQKCLNIKIK